MQYLSVGTNVLTGIVPKELGKLTNLVSLGFSTNKLDGPLPEELQNLTKLKKLYIDSCGLSGELPSTLSKLANLIIFWASDNNFTGKIPDYIGRLSSLKDLRLHGNYFEGPIPASLSNLVELTTLQIGDLVSESSSLAFLANMTSLLNLTLRSSRISDNLGSVEFPKFVQLRYLDLSFNSITGKVPPTLLNLRSLTFLFLGSNNLSGSLPDTISRSLATLDFSYNMLSGGFPSWVSTNNLHVNLVSNNFTIDGFNSSVGSNIEEEGPKKNKTVLVVAVVVGAAVVGFLALTGTFVWRQKRKRLEVEMEELFSIVGRPNVFRYGEIKSATDNFSPSNILGRGGYGLVYKGRLLDGTLVAVKHLSPTSRQGKREFMAEIATISAVQHRNLVKLRGCCIQSNAPLLVYEYMENGSLDRAIFGKTNLNLDWRTRFEICVGIARGLAYLHEESSTRIVHRDIKTSNVLLDADLNPKISDFGLARHYKDSMTHLSTGVAGTLGYLAPEYAMMGHLTEKADVFAFGIVALEIIAGRPNFDESLEEDKKYLLGLAWRLHESRQTLELLDPKLAEFDEEEAARVISGVLLCTMGLPQRRPPMSKVVSMLTEDIEMTQVDATMRPSYVPEWQLQSGSDGLLWGSSMQQSSGGQASAPSSSSNNPKLHRDTSPLALSPCSSDEIDERGGD